MTFPCERSGILGPRDLLRDGGLPAGHLEVQIGVLTNG